MQDDRDEMWWWAYVASLCGGRTTDQAAGQADSSLELYEARFPGRLREPRPISAERG